MYTRHVCTHVPTHTLTWVCGSPGIQLQAARVCEQTHARVQGAQIQPHTRRGSHSVPSPAGLWSQEGQQWLLCILCVSFQGSPQIPVPEPSKNEPGDKAADFLAHCPQPAATKNLSLGLLPSLPFCLCLMPLPSLATLSDCTWSCFLAFPHTPLRHRQ